MCPELTVAVTVGECYTFVKVRKMGIDAGKIMRSVDEETLQHKKEVLRYVLYCANHIDMFQRLFNHLDFGK